MFLSASPNQWKNMSEKRRIVSNTLANGLAQFAAIASALVFMPMLIRAFGLNDFGLYLLASSVGAYAGLVDFGVGTSLVKNVAERAAKNDSQGIGKYVSTSLLFYIVVGVLVALIIGGLACVSGSLFKVSADGARLLRNLLLVVAFTSVWTWPASTGGLVLAGLQRHTLFAATSIFAAVANVGVILAVLSLHEGPVALLAGQSVVGLIAAAVNIGLARRVVGSVPIHPRHADMAVFRDIVSFSWVIFVLQVCAVILYQQTDRVVLGVFLGAAAVTMYEAAGKMQGLVTQLTQFATSAVMPFAAQLDAEDRTSSLQTLFFRGTKYVMALVLPVVVGLILLASPIITHWLGPSFAPQALTARILLSYQLLGVSVVIGESILISRGHARRRLFNSIFVLTLGNLVLSIVLVQRIGILGVAIGTAIPWIVDFPMRLRVALTEVGVSLRDWFMRSAGPVYLSLVATAAVAFLAYRTPLVDSLLGLALTLVLCVGASWGFLAAFTLTPVEKAEIRSLGRSLRGRIGHRD
jgi:O-antigen/teichoic acid export membrane protein